MLEETVVKDMNEQIVDRIVKKKLPLYARNHSITVGQKYNNMLITRNDTHYDPSPVDEPKPPARYSTVMRPRKSKTNI